MRSIDVEFCRRCAFAGVPELKELVAAGAKCLVGLGNDPGNCDLDGGAVMSDSALNPDVVGTAGPVHGVARQERFGNEVTTEREDGKW